MPLDAATRAMLWQLRGRKSPSDRRQWWLVLPAVVLLHGLFMLLVWHEMRPPAAAPTVVHLRLDQSLQLRFVASAPAATVRPAPAMRPPPPPAPARRIHAPPAAAAMTLRLPTPGPPRTLRLYDRDGQPLLPAQAASASTAGLASPALSGDTRIMRHTDPVRYRATRFERYFPPPGETLGGAAVRHVVEAVVKSTAVDLPRGIHLKCTTVLGIPIPNCIDPPAPPSAKEGDERLSMAPARPLAIDPHAPAPPGVAACIAMYRAGRSLAQGCPVDTPGRSVDAELRMRRAGAAGRP
ncbi:MAG: hypothetical protein KGJ63_07455 [Pseudomonadota bacterium]|nr:hypothetical protein [Pseudomonadota bacterium]